MPSNRLDIEVLRVETPQLRRAFLNLPYSLYRGHPFWVPPFRRAERHLFNVARHPFYRHARAAFFLALRHQRPAGRVAVFLDELAQQPGAPLLGTFGFFECVQDLELARSLLKAAFSWLRAQGARRVRGPYNPSFLYSFGLLVDGFEDWPTLGTTYNFPYYGSLLESAGLAPAKDFLAISLTVDALRSPLLERWMRIAQSSGDWEVRIPDRRQFDREVARAYDVLLHAWAGNWGFHPPSCEELTAYFRTVLPLLDLRLLRFIEQQGQPVGALMVVPDWNQIFFTLRGRLFPLGWFRVWRGEKNIRRARILALGVVPELRNTGAPALFRPLVELNREKRYTELEASLVAEDNHPALRSLLLLGGRPTKRYRIYEASL